MHFLDFYFKQPLCGTEYTWWYTFSAFMFPKHLSSMAPYHSSADKSSSPLACIQRMTSQRVEKALLFICINKRTLCSYLSWMRGNNNTRDSFSNFFYFTRLSRDDFYSILWENKCSSQWTTMLYSWNGILIRSFQ